MVWYNPATWFKNTPTINLKKAKVPQQDTTVQTVTQEQPQEITSQDVVQQPKKKEIGVFDNPFGLIMDAVSDYKSRSIYEANKDKTKFEVEGFDLDPYNVSQGMEITDSPVDHSVDSEKANKMVSIFAKTFLPKIDSAISKGNTDDLKFTIGDAADLLKNYVTEELSLDNVEPISFGDIKKGIDTYNQYGGELQYKTKVKFDNDRTDKDWDTIIRYDAPQKQELYHDIGLYSLYEDAYKEGLLGEVTWENTKDAFYEKYKDKFSLHNRRKSLSNGSAFQDGIITKDYFFGFVDNELTKQVAYGEMNSESQLLKSFENDKSESRLSQLVQRGINKIAPSVQESLIGTVEGRQEFMNDTYANLTDTFGRWNNVMYGSYWTKAHLQRLYNTTDLSSAPLTPEHKAIYDNIVWVENALDQFVRNYTEWVSLMPDYVNPNTGKLDRIPDSVVDPATGQMISYRDFLFKGVDMSDDRWLPLVANTAQSPQDILDYNTRKIRLSIENLEDGLLGRLWNYFQYGGSTYVGATVNEVSQQLIGKPLATVESFLSKSSGDIPSDFVNMDTSIMASMTTNKSTFGRLMQNFLIKTDEYVPEIVGQIGFNWYLGKGLNNLGELAQIRTLGLANKVSWARNSTQGQQFAHLISYAARALQLLGTDQTIDAVASIGDTESLSPFSKILSLGGTFLGEGIGILKDLKVLNRSILMNFSKNKATGGLVDPIRLIAENPKILDKYAEQIGRGVKDESGKIVGDQYKLLLQDLNQYAKGLKIMSDTVTETVNTAIKNGFDISRLNTDVKTAAYNVLKQVFRQDSAMARVVTDMLTDQRVNIADMVKYIGDLEGIVKVGPWVSTIKLTDNMGNTYAKMTAKKYNNAMDLILEGGLVRKINDGFTKQDIDNLVKGGFLKDTVYEGGDVSSNYFIKRLDGDDTLYFPTEEGLKALGVETSVVAEPLAIVSMSKDTREMIDKLKSLPEGKKKISNNLLEQIGETNAIDSLARDIADIDILDICK